MGSSACSTQHYSELDSQLHILWSCEESASVPLWESLQYSCHAEAVEVTLCHNLTGLHPKHCPSQCLKSIHQLLRCPFPLSSLLLSHCLTLSHRIYAALARAYSKKKSTSEHLFWCFRLAQIEDSIQYLEGPNSTWKDHNGN